MSKYIPGSGPPGCKLMVVGEAGGEQEEKLGEVLVGPTGKEVERLFNQSGSSLKEVWKTNVIKYHPPDNNYKRIGELTDSQGKPVTLEGQQDYLWKEIEAIQPNAILTLGNLPLVTLTGKTGISKWRGSLLLCRLGIKVIPTIHPASYLRYQGAGSTPYSARVYVQKDVERAIVESRTKELILPQRTVDIARSLYDVVRFFEIYKDERDWAIDIETANCVPTCIALSPNPFHAISIPLLHESHFRIPHSELVEIWLILMAFFARKDIRYWFQNGKFDHDKIEEILGILLQGQVYVDTMLLAKVLHPELPGSLAWITSVYTREPYYKDEGKNFDPKRDKPEQFHVYNGKDSCVTIESGQAMLPYLKEYDLEDYFFNYKMPQHRLYMKMERRGFKINEKLRAEKIRDYDIKAFELEYILFNIVGREFNVNSPQQVKDVLFNDLKLPVREGTDEDTLTALLSNHAKTGKKRDFITGLLELRSVNKVRGATYLRSDPDYDGRARSSWKVSGTETDRSSTTKLDEPLRPTESGWAAQTLSKHSEIGGDLCEIIEADEPDDRSPDGYLLLNADLSQAEARVVANLANDYETLELFNKTDIHRKTASWLFKCDMRDVTDELRFVGKTVRHAGNYGMGKKRLMQIIAAGARRFKINILVSEFQAGKILETFHQYTPKIKGVYHVEIERILQENNRIIVCPSGFRRQFFGRPDYDMVKEALALIPQNTVRWQVVRAMLEIDEKYPWIELQMETHDAFLAQIPKGREEEAYWIIKKLMERPISFQRGSLPRPDLIIPCDIAMGETYKGMKKVKYAG